jgi:regulator of protease activity HflC (stomatin/prohibitin superfamily)
VETFGSCRVAFWHGTIGCMSEAFSKILELIIAWWTALKCWEILDVEEIGFIRRFGKPVRDLKPGWNWRWPIIESGLTENAQEGVYCLDPQSLRTTDGVELVVRVSVTFRIVDIRKYYLEAWGALNNIRDLVAGEVGEAVSASTKDEVFDGTAIKLAQKSSREHAKEWGIKIIRLRRIDAAQGQSHRLWQTQTTASGQG